MRLQTGKIVLKYIENFVRREREAVNRFRDFLSDVVRQSDMVLLSLCTVSTLYGMVLIASATHFRNTFKYVAIQGFGLLLGVLLYFLLSSIDVSEVGKKWKWLLAFNFGFILLLRTPFGLTRNGNRAWLGVNDIGKRLGVGFLENFPITVQPAEIVKITFIILLARQLALLQEKKDLTRFSNVIQPTAHAGAMFVFYYILSKDAGSGLVYLFVFLCMAFAAGYALRWIFLGVGGAVGAFLAAWNLGLLRGDWYDRIKVILDHSYQPEKKGFQQTRGMLALGSGKLTGQGLFQGTQTQSSAKWSLPERQTDFIFCVCGEELGFIGCLLIIVLLLAIIVRCLIVARSAEPHGKPCVRRHGGHAHLPDHCQHRHVLVSYAGHRADAAVFQLRRLVDRDAVRCDGGCVGHQEAVKAGVAHQLTFQKRGFSQRESPLLRLSERWRSRLSDKIALRFVPCRPQGGCDTRGVRRVNSDAHVVGIYD